MNSSLIISDRFKDLKNEIFDEIKYAFNMELIRVRIYLCKRVPEVLSRIDKEAVS